MNRRVYTRSRKVLLLCGLLLFLETTRLLMGEPTAAANSAFDDYSRSVESRMAQQHRSPGSFLVFQHGDGQAQESRLRQGAVLVERLTPGAELDGALLHHWRGTAFAPGAKAADFKRLMQDFRSYPQHFAPQVIRAGVLAQRGDQMQAWIRVRQQHIITVVMDTTYNITFSQLDAQHGYSVSQSTRIAEIAAPDTREAHALTASEEHGFLWRLNTYWSYEERDGGLYLQIESVSLTRTVPAGLGWAVRPYVESIPRESLEFTLRSACNALRKSSL